jgi:hypothetical protein
MEAAFIFIAPEADAAKHTARIETPVVKLTIVGVKNYEEAVTVARALLDKGVTAFELCAGFGNEGVALVSKALEGKAQVGAVRFDAHPGLGFKSGDALFA